MKLMATAAVLLSVMAVPCSAAPAKPAGCPLMKSAASTDAATVIFRNQLPVPVDLMWYDFDGKLWKYATLAPTQVYNGASYIHHVWAAVKQDGTCALTMQVKGSFNMYVIK